MKVAATAAAALLGLVGLAVGMTTAYEAGRDASRSAIECPAGEVLAIRSLVTEGADLRSIERTLRVGSCERISEEAFAAALEALAGDSFKEPADCANVASGPQPPTSTPAPATPSTAASATGVPTTTSPTASACPNPKS